MMFRLILISTAVLLSYSPLHAQTDPVPPATQRAILHAVAEHVLQTIESGTAELTRDVVVVFDHAVLQDSTPDQDAVWPTHVTEEFGRMPGVRLGTLNDHYTCDEFPPGQCDLEGADMVVTFGRPDLDGESGTIWVRHVSRATADIDSPRAYRSSKLLKIERENDGWVVVGAESVIVS